MQGQLIKQMRYRGGTVEGKGVCYNSKVYFLDPVTQPKKYCLLTKGSFHQVLPQRCIEREKSFYSGWLSGIAYERKLNNYFRLLVWLSYDRKTHSDVPSSIKDLQAANWGNNQPLHSFVKSGYRVLTVT